MNTEALDHHAASDCPNCAAAVSGNFCHQCGQETVLHPPSIHEFLHEFIGHYVALEGKLWKTLGLLLFRPGRLTLEYLAGRRVRYVQPLRVYLTFSLIFFAIFKFMGETHEIAGVKVGGMPVVQVGDEEIAERKRERAELQAELEAQKNKEELAKFEGLKSIEDGLIDNFSGDNGKHIKTAFFGYAPYAVFALMPLFALLLKLLYLGSGRRYGEHLLFALHTNAFAFLVLGLMVLTRGLAPAVGKLLFLWMLLYLPMAMRRVYGGGRFATFLRWSVLMTSYMVIMGIAIVSVLYMIVQH
ncbi:DUF3667 domain-containing protein [uncultured Massilia sp.]|uniref:DUF3667 domain-containing protein n=1 Tax=uncultured Massilia sp. TaxID=169973 RepID=UPI0025F91EAE|nr:DUF3667 domain-containing protein [uncultured Massilia sp.]